MVSQLKNINVDVQDESDRLLYPLSLSPFLFKYIITRTLSLQFQVNARLDRTNWTWFHGIYILSLTHSLEYESHWNELADEIHIRALYIRFIGLFKVYIYTGRTVGVVAPLNETSNARFQRRYAFRYSTDIEYCIALRQSSCFANRNDFRGGRRFGRRPLSVEGSVRTSTNSIREKRKRVDMFIYLSLVSMEAFRC